MSKTYTKTRTLVECALMIAIGTVLSNIKFFTLPNGGSITLLSMLPFVLVSFRHGVKWGLFTGFVNGCLQILLGGGLWAPPTPTFLCFLAARSCWTTSSPSWRSAWQSSLPAPSRTVLSAWPWAPSCRWLPAVPVQLPVRRAHLGQPDGRPARLDLQPDLQRQLYAAGDPADHGGCCAVVPCGTPDL